MDQTFVCACRDTGDLDVFCDYKDGGFKNLSGQNVRAHRGDSCKCGHICREMFQVRAVAFGCGVFVHARGGKAVPKVEGPAAGDDFTDRIILALRLVYSDHGRQSVYVF